MSAQMTNITRTAPRPCDAMAFVMRYALLIAGSAMVFAAFALWLVPGSTHLPELTLIKLGLTLFLLISGLCAWVSGKEMRV